MSPGPASAWREGPPPGELVAVTPEIRGPVQRVRGAVGRTFRSLRLRNYRLYMTGQSLLIDGGITAAYTTPE